MSATPRPVLREVYEFSGKVVADVLGASIPFSGINVAPDAGPPKSVRLFVVDEERLLKDTSVCGPTGRADDIPPAQVEVCLRASAVADNCAVIAPRTIACDFRLLWRLSRYATVLTLASLKKPGLDEYYFSRDDLRRKFLSGEAKYATTDARLKNLEDIEKFFSEKLLMDVKDTRTRVLRGFLAFLLSHEVGHVVLGHAGAAAMPPCALSAPSSTVAMTHLCQPVDSRETEADRIALAYLGRDLSGDSFTPARASPELFMEEYERRVYLATLDAGKDPATWSYDTAGPEERAVFEKAWITSVATGSHPKDLARYVALLALLQSKGVVLTASADKKRIAANELTWIETACKNGKP